jgi:hypothetical protein
MKEGEKMKTVKVNIVDVLSTQVLIWNTPSY